MAERTPPRVIAVLSGDVQMREPWLSEENFFRSRPEVSGLAAEDDCVVINPYSKLSELEKEAVALNEAARVVMRRDGFTPAFDLTEKQISAFASYGPMDAIKETIAARLLSGDPSALEPTIDQTEFVRQLAERMNISRKG